MESADTGGSHEAEADLREQAMNGSSASGSFDVTSSPTCS